MDDKKAQKIELKRKIKLNQSKIDHSDINILAYKQYKNKLTNILRKSERNYYGDELEKIKTT